MFRIPKHLIVLLKLFKLLKAGKKMYFLASLFKKQVEGQTNEESSCFWKNKKNHKSSKVNSNHVSLVNLYLSILLGHSNVQMKMFSNHQACCF